MKYDTEAFCFWVAIVGLICIDIALISFLILKFTSKGAEPDKNDITKKRNNRTINIMISFVIIAVILFLFLNFLLYEFTYMINLVKVRLLNLISSFFLILITVEIFLSKLLFNKGKEKIANILIILAIIGILIYGLYFCCNILSTSVQDAMWSN